MKIAAIGPKPGAWSVLIFILSILLLEPPVAGARANAQSTVTLSETDAPLVRVLKKIQKQTGIPYFGPKALLEKSDKITIHVKNARLIEALEMIFTKQPLTYSLVGKVIIIKAREELPENKQTTNSPQVDVSGRVLNERGEPVEGVTVTIKGTKRATVTNANGEFSFIDLQNNAILVFTGINVETAELKLNGRTEVEIKLAKKVASLSDVTVKVSTGYEQMPKERATGSFELVNKEQLNRRVGVDILSRLEGVTTGIFFDKRSVEANTNTVEPNNILIRGLSTLTGSIKTPLIILNNFPYAGDINNINPNDSDNITILKDAAAASIWGARAGNGVIVITTKQGKFNQPAVISFTSNVNVIEKPDLFHYKRMSSSDFIEVERYLFEQGFYDGEIGDNFSWPALSPVVEILTRQRDGNISPGEAAAQIEQLSRHDLRNDFDKYVYRTAINQQYAINISGGSEKAKYLLSAGFDKYHSNLIGNEGRRITLRSDNTFAVVKNFELQFSIGYTDNQSAANSIGNFGSVNYDYRTNNGKRSLYPYAQLADANGNPLAIAKEYRKGFTDTAGGGKLLDWSWRPLDEIRNADNSTNQKDIVVNLSGNYRITDFLRLQANYQYQNTKGTGRNFYSDQTYFTRDLINKFTQVVDGEPSYAIPKGSILDLNYFEILSQAARTQLSIDKTFNRLHKIVSIIGGEVTEKRLTSNMERTYGLDKNTVLTP
jgi:TonB-dependent starch-binding outer membrane protein SusC